MKRGFYTIMSAQFFSSLADNALFVAAVELLQTLHGARHGSAPALVPMFALFYVVLAPFVGAFADAVPKGKVMFISNAIKVVGCLMMLFGTPPAAGLRHRRPGRGGLLAGQVRHPDRAAAALAAGQGQRLDRGPDDRCRSSWASLLGGQLVGRQVSRHLLGLRPADHRHRHRHARPKPPSPRSSSCTCWRRCSTCTSRAPSAAAADAAAAAGAWCATSRTATRGCGATSSARSRWPPPRCSGASAATCATSCWPGPRWRWATAPRRPRRWSAWWPSAPPSARSWRRCACGWTRPPA